MTKKIRTIIVDDIPAAITKLSHDLRSYPEIEIIGCLPSAKEAIELIIEQQPELLFLDMEMPEMSGLELLNQLKEEVRDIRVVFYTAFNQYLLDAVRASAFDYLLKPYLPEELYFIINRLLATWDKPVPNFKNSLYEFIQKENKFAIQTITGLMLVKCTDVGVFQYTKSLRCWTMKLADGTQHKLRTNIGAKELLPLSNLFVQINQQCVINLDYLISIENKTLKCILYPPFSNIDETVSTRFYKKIKDDLDII